MGDTLWQLEIDDTSPSILYSPFPDTFSTPNLGAGWNPYDESLGFAPAQGTVGNGSRSHITSMDGASFSIQWRGTGIQIFGNTTQASFSVALNSAALNIGNVSSQPISTAANGLLADIGGLPDGLHTLTLTAVIPLGQIPRNSSMVVFDKVVLHASTPLPSNDSSSSSMRQIIDRQNIAFSGQWASENGASASYQVSRTARDRATTTFNGTIFTLFGSTSSNGANFSVLVDGVKTTLSSRSSFNVDNTTLFFVTGLNSSMEHSVEVTNDSGGQLSLLTEGFTTVVSSAPPPPPSPAAASSNNSSFSKGTVAALTLAGVLAFILLTSAILYLCIYKRRRRLPGNIRAFYTFSRPGSATRGSSEPRGQRWLNDLLIKTPKQQEAGVVGYGDVLDIRPGGSDSKEDLADIDEVTRESTVTHEKPEPRTTERRSGFSRWRRDAVEGNMKGIGLPIFRYSGPGAKASTGAEPNVQSPYRESTQEAGPRYSHVRDRSEDSSDSSSERRYIAMANLRNKGKARQITGTGSSPSHQTSHSAPTRRSWSPSFHLALPIPSPSKPSGSKFKWTIPGTARWRQRESSIASTQSKSLPPSPGGHQAQASNGSGQDQLSSFVAASEPSPVVTRKRVIDTLQPIRPPSYAASQHDSPTSSNGVSMPRSVSQSDLQSPVHPTHPRSPLHQRQGAASDDNDNSQASPHKLEEGPQESSATSTSYPVHNVHRQPDSTQHSALMIGIPIDTRRQQRESVSSSDNVDPSPSVVAPPSVGQAIRGLSPRTSERGTATGSGTSLGLRHLYRSARQSTHTQASIGQSLTSASEGESSPVEFARDISPSGVPLALQSTTSLVTATVEDSLGQTEGQSWNEPVQLDLRAMSPFHVDFDWRSVRTRTNISHSSADETPAAYQTSHSRQSRVSHSSGDVIPPLPAGPSFVQGSSRAPFRLTMETIAHPPPDDASIMSTDPITSFLDFTSSREGSVRTKSLRTVASHERIFGDPNAPPLPIPPPELRSRWSNTTAPSYNTRRFTGITKESSGDSDAHAFSTSEGEHSSGSNTFPIHVNMTLPPSPHHVMDFQEGSQPRRSSRRTSTTGRSSGLPPHIHPVIDLESPTDSVPRTVSDIHFSQSEIEDVPPMPRRIAVQIREPGSQDRVGILRRPLPQISMVPPSQPQSPVESPSLTRPRPLPIPPVTGLSVPENPNLKPPTDS